VLQTGLISGTSHLPSLQANVFLGLTCTNKVNMRSIIIAGFIQAVFMAFFLFYSDRGNQRANRILAFYFLLFACFLIVPELIRTSVEVVPHLIAISFPLLYLIGPCLYLYSGLLLNKNRPPGKKAFVHILPFAISLLYLFPFYLKDAAFKLSFIRSAKTSGLSIDFSILWLIACIHIVIYQFIVFYNVREYNRLTIQYFSKVDRVRINWLERFSFLNSCLWTIYFVGYVLLYVGADGDIFGYIDQIFAIILTMLLYYLTFVGLSKPEIFPGPYLPALEKVVASKDQISGNRNEHLTHLKNLMLDRKPFLDPDISLSSLAIMLDISPRVLSQVINEMFGKSFFEFVNYYRIEEAKKRLIDPQYEHLTIVAIGLDSGFNSKSTFNDVFKKLEKCTPSQYKLRNRLS
jgi:AraC-like DNA-binding protein